MRFQDSLDLVYFISAAPVLGRLFDTVYSLNFIFSNSREKEVYLNLKKHCFVVIVVCS